MGLAVKETLVTEKILALLDSMGAYRIKHHVSQFSTAGVPDILACLNGRFIGIEVKKDAAIEPSKLQAEHLRRIRAAGGVAFYTHSLDDCIEKLGTGLELYRPPMLRNGGLLPDAETPSVPLRGEGRHTRDQAPVPGCRCNRCYYYDSD